MLLLEDIIGKSRPKCKGRFMYAIAI